MRYEGAVKNDASAKLLPARQRKEAQRGLRRLMTMKSGRNMGGRFKEFFTDPKYFDQVS